MTRPLARFLDAALEASVVGSFSNIGYIVRARLWRWAPHQDLTGKIAVVTGATSGLGLETAAELAQGGAQVFILARDAGKAAIVIEALTTRVGRDAFTFVEADMGSFDSVRSCATALQGLAPRIDILVHNAGALTTTYGQSPDGVEATIATHLLGPFLLTSLLRDQLRAAAPGRVITVASGGMYSWKFALSDLVMSPEAYDGVKAYARAKRAQVVLGHEWARRESPADILFATMHPGWTDTPGLAASLPGFYRVVRRWLRTPAQGVDTILWLSTNQELASRNGDFFFDRAVRSEHKMRTRTVNPARDQIDLWSWCCDETGAHVEE